LEKLSFAAQMNVLADPQATQQETLMEDPIAKGTSTQCLLNINGIYNSG
jgi:hypothetical protein